MIKLLKNIKKIKIKIKYNHKKILKLLNLIKDGKNKLIQKKKLISILEKILEESIIHPIYLNHINNLFLNLQANLKKLILNLKFQPLKNHKQKIKNQIYK